MTEQVRFTLGPGATNGIGWIGQACRELEAARSVGDVAMKLSWLEREVLRFIDERYPIARTEPDRKKMIAMGERPLPTAEDITSISAPIAGMT